MYETFASSSLFCLRNLLNMTFLNCCSAKISIIQPKLSVFGCTTLYIINVLLYPASNVSGPHTFKMWDRWTPSGQAHSSGGPHCLKCRLFIRIGCYRLELWASSRWVKNLVFNGTCLSFTHGTRKWILHL